MPAAAVVVVERTEEAPAQENSITHSSYLLTLLSVKERRQWHLVEYRKCSLLTHWLWRKFFSLFFFAFVVLRERRGDPTQNGRRLGGIHRKKNTHSNWRTDRNEEEKKNKSKLPSHK